MPPGAKKRKALKKKKEQEAIGSSTNQKDFNGHGHDEHGSQDETETDGSLSSPGSQGNEEFWTRDLSPSPLSGLGKIEDADFTQGQGVKGEDVIAVERRTDHEKNGVDKQHVSFPDNLTHNTREAASLEADGIASLVDSVKPMCSSVSQVVISDKIEQVGSSLDSDSFKQKSDANEEKRRQEAKEGESLGSDGETSKEIKSLKESECSEEKSLLPSGSPAVRTSWFSCCGLFDVMAGSER